MDSIGVKAVKSRIEKASEQTVFPHKINWVKKYLEEMDDLDQEDEKLPFVKPPYLPPLSTDNLKSKIYTLVIDLDETLIHLIEVE